MESVWCATQCWLVGWFVGWLGGWLVGWLFEFYPEGPRKGVLVSSKAHVYPPTHILSDQGGCL